MERIMRGETTPAQFGAFVAGLRAKGETVDEIVGLVSTMRRFVLRVEVEGPLVDTCGTGGDRSGSVNVSTMAAFVAAGAGARVAKHGNRSASSACGSADVLERLGVRIELSPGAVARCIDEAGIGFCFAPAFHPAMRHAIGPRRELGVPTVFNFLGPLTNPAGALHQVVGVSNAAMAPRMAEVLRRLGCLHALVCHGSDGLDEITTTGTTSVWEVTPGGVAEWELDPVDVGIPRSDPPALLGGDAGRNAVVLEEVLAGKAGPVLDIVLVNAAAAILAAGLASDLGAAVALARESVDSGRARAALDALVEVSNRP
ncbi:MAG TPA: anthranilate phosphoribosyltransferase, partial [Actinomycetota bacterium]|jgi:anthranilate phosphoribosyltransferase